MYSPMTNIYKSIAPIILGPIGSSVDEKAKIVNI